MVFIHVNYSVSKQWGRIWNNDKLHCWHFWDEMICHRQKFSALCITRTFLSMTLKIVFLLQNENLTSSSFKLMALLSQNNVLGMCIHAIAIMKYICEHFLLCGFLRLSWHWTFNRLICDIDMCERSKLLFFYLCVLLSAEQYIEYFWC